MIRPRYPHQGPYPHRRTIRRQHLPQARHFYGLGGPGLRVIPLRNTRHTCSSLLVALKVHPKVAQRILHHSQIAMTMEAYAATSDEETRDASGKLSDAMGG